MGPHVQKEQNNALGLETTFLWSGALTYPLGLCRSRERSDSVVECLASDPGAKASPASMSKTH